MEKTLILVIGCPRSGTSAVAGSLAAAGVNFGDNLIPPARDNPKGFFENVDVVALHDRLLDEHGANWDRPPTVKLDCRDAVDECRAILSALPGPVCGIKDPRASLFVDLWREACKKESILFCVLEVERDTSAAAVSLAVREGWSRDRAMRLTLDYHHLIMKSSGCDQGGWAVIKFPSELNEDAMWAGIFFGFYLDNPDLGALCSFFDPSLVHHGREAAHAA